MKLINLREYIVKRASSGDDGYYDDDGNFINGDQDSGQFTIRGNLQPITGKDLQLLGDGFKATDIRKLYTLTELKTLDEDSETEADLVIIDTKEYQVQIVEPWIGRRLSHFKVLLSKVEKS